jgi:hypothetical protein
MDSYPTIDFIVRRFIKAGGLNPKYIRLHPNDPRVPQVADFKNLRLVMSENQHYGSYLLSTRDPKTDRVATSTVTLTKHWRSPTTDDNT